MEMKQQIIENNQIDIFKINHILKKALNNLKEKDQDYENLLIVVVKLAGHNFKNDVVIADPKKTEIIHKNSRSLDVRKISLLCLKINLYHSFYFLLLHILLHLLEE